MLSQRMLANASLVPIGSKVADIGCDHGFVSIYLCENGMASKIIAMDVNQAPLEQAKKHIKEANLSTTIECRLSNGMEKLEAGEVDTILIGGMGGSLIISILSAGLERLMEMKHLILQPQSELDKVRHFLHNNGFAIQKECMVCEKKKTSLTFPIKTEAKSTGKYYTSIYAIHGKQQFKKETEYLYGCYLPQNRDLIFKQYIENEKKKYEGILRRLNHTKLKKSTAEKAKEKRKKLSKILQEIDEMRKYYE